MQLATGNAASEGSQGWTSARNSVVSMTIYNGKLHVGLGNGADDADIWVYDGSWTKLRASTSWGSGYDEVSSLAVYKGDLYAGLGSGTGEAEVWKYDGSVWIQVGGDGSGESGSERGWNFSYEKVRSMVTYNGELYVSLGDSAGDGEVWKYNGSLWIKVAGDGTNSSWPATIELVNDMLVYRGKLYAATGITSNTDAAIWAYGDNSILTSTRSNWNASDPYHISATYDGVAMRLNVTPSSTGVTETNTSNATKTIPDNQLDLLIGSSYGAGRKYQAQGFFKGSIDEVRLSNEKRSSFTTSPFASEKQTISNADAVFTEDIAYYTGFSVVESLDGGNITYRLSSDGGLNWKYWNGGSWTVSSSYIESNTPSDVDQHIQTFPVTEDGIKWQAILTGNGYQQVALNEVTITAEPDTANPNPPSALDVRDAQTGETELVSNSWYPYSSPYFAWSGATDVGGAGIKGYCVYFGTNINAIPCEEGSFQEETYYIPSNMTTGTTYYFRLQSKDNAQNISALFPESGPFIYKFDNTGPSLPGTVSVSPLGYTAENNFTFFWPSTGVNKAKDCAETENCAGLAGYQYKIGNQGEWSATTTITEINIPNAAYQDGVNYFYLRTVDNAGNISVNANGTPAVYTVPFYYAGSAPTAPRNLSSDPVTSESAPSDTNMFTFSWDPPEEGGYSGSETELTYCYTINVEPGSDGNGGDNCTYTSRGITVAGPQAFATLPTKNTFYVVAKDSVGNINYGAYTSIDFYVNTTVPGIPLNVEIADVSVKSTSSWKLALSWEPPTIGDVSKYEIFRSVDNQNFSRRSTVEGGIAFVDTGLTQQNYYYKVRACDNTNKCGAFSSTVSMLPTGRFTEPPELVSDPVVSDVTTKKATISWITNREADSRVQFGKSEGDYFDEEPSNSQQVIDHRITLNNLSPGTTYYYVVKWTDEDGNTGVSQEFKFSTNPAPKVTDPKIKNVSIESAILEFTVEGATKVRVYYGETAALGGVLELSTSTNETTYSVNIEALKDNTKYYYKIVTYDTEDNEYEGNILSFQTLPKPRIENVNIIQIKEAAKTSLLVSWITNTPVSSIVTYYPKSNVGEAKDATNLALTSGKHRMVITDLLPQTSYAIVVSGKDRVGNEVSSGILDFTTSADARAPYIENLKVEGSTTPVAKGSNEKVAQLIISWDTDEPATAQVEFGEGTGATYTQKTKEDSSMTYNHVVVVSNLVPSKVYHFRAVSKDSAGNIGYSIDTVSITPKATDDALTLVISNLKQVFGFIGKFQ